VTPNFEYSCRQPPACGLRNIRFSAPRFPPTVTHLPGNLGRKFQPLTAPSVAVRPRSVAPRHQSNSEDGHRFVLPGTQKDCRISAQACQVCQRTKVSSHVVTPVGDLMLPAARFLHVHTDLVGYLPTSAGYACCLSAADTVVHALLNGRISRFGCPQTITTDLERQFELQFFHSLAAVWNSSLQEKRPPFHSQRTRGDSHHVPRRSAMDRGTSTGSSLNLHGIQSGPASVSN
jgi:hypothetical protein